MSIERVEFNVQLEDWINRGVEDTASLAEVTGLGKITAHILWHLQRESISHRQEIERVSVCLICHYTVDV